MSKAKITIPLDLPDVEVLEVKLDKHGFRISVESTLRSTRCRQCGREIGQLHEVGEWVEVRHLPILDQVVMIRYRPKR